MPEIKHDFSGGKMNKDLDERIVPNGQYRDAMNIQVRTTGSDGGVGNAGCVQNLQGNKVVAESIHYEYEWVNSNNCTKFIGSVANEKDNKAYFLLSSPDYNKAETFALNNINIISDIELNRRKVFIDYIVEVDTGDTSSPPICNPVVVDRYAIIDKASNVIDQTGNQIQQQGGDGWTSLDVLDASELRVGMIMQAYNEDGLALIKSTYNYDGEYNYNNNQFGYQQNEIEDYGAEIQNIVGNTVYVYTGQDEITDWSVAKVFTFIAKERVLNFYPDMIITGINIIDDLLFWTDDRDEPKRVNITRCKAGSPDFTTHTQLKLKDPNDDSNIFDYTGNSATIIEESLSPTINNDLKKEHVTVIRKPPQHAPTVEMLQSDRAGVTQIDSFKLNLASFEDTNQNVQLGDTFTIPEEGDILVFDDDDVSNNNEAGNNAFIFNNTDFRVNDILRFQENTFDSDSWITVSVDNIEQVPSNNEDPNGNEFFTVLTLRVLTINKPLIPTLYQQDENGNDVPTIDGSGEWTITLEQRDPMFELIFGRFSTRYKYEDGEWSSFGPWSELVFLPGNFDYDHKKGYNLGMTNTVRKITIKDFVPHQRVRAADITAVDILYRKTVGPDVYVVKTITRGRDAEWDNFIIDINNSTLAFGEMEIQSEKANRMLPEMQGLRAWDNVPITAKAQEVAANRLVFSNYTQGYEIIEKPGLMQSLKNFETPSLNNPMPSMKSIRDYKIGMVFGDKYGRETPVISPGFLEHKHHGRWGKVDGNVRVPKNFSAHQNVLQLQQSWGDEPDMAGIPDDWISYVKYYIKETSNEYYNLVMDKWYEAEDGNIWLSFASADRNKIDEDTYLILKNEHGSNEPVLEKARYKILAIENSAPEFIQTQVRPLGQVVLGAFSFGDDFNEYPFWSEDMYEGTPDPLNSAPTKLIDGTEILIHRDMWNGFLDDYEAEGDLEVRLKVCSGVNCVTEPAANGWRLLTYYHTTELPTDSDGIPVDPDDINGSGALRWAKPFGESQVDLWDLLLQDTGGSTPIDPITWVMEFRELIVKSQPEFEGKFFVKIQKDAILTSKVLSQSAAQTTYRVAYSYPIAYIENSEYNPSAMFSEGADDYMPRRAYKWLNQPDLVHVGGDNGVANQTTQNTDSYKDEELFEVIINGIPSDITLDVNAAWSGDSSGYVANLDAGEFWKSWSGDTEWPYCQNSAGVAGVTNSPDWAQPQSVSNFWGYGSDGCHPYDAEFMALGCIHTEGYVAFGDAGDFPEPIGGVDNDSNVMNRTRETRRFWEWFNEYASTTNSQNTQGNHGAKLFIDGMRTRITRFENSLIDDQWQDQTGETHSGIYYKQTGITPGLLSTTSEPDMFSPTMDGHLGRMVISASGSQADLSIIPLYAELASYGTKFRFMNDPNNKTYQVITNGATSITMDMKNHSQHWESVEGANPADGDCVGAFWTNSPYFWNDATEGIEYANPVADDDKICSDRMDCTAQLGWSNINPKHSINSNQSGGPYASYADGVNTFVTIGGIKNNDQGPTFVPNSDFDTCHPCGEVEFAGNQDGYTEGNANGGPTCQRSGLRIEFREFNESTGGLVNGENPGDHGIDLSLWDPRGSICHDGRESMQIGIVKDSMSSGEIYIPPSDPAIWETEPKEDLGIDIYYEASGAIPMKLTSENTPLFAPYNSKIEKKIWNGGGYVDSIIDSAGTTFPSLPSYVRNTKVYYIGYTKSSSIIGIQSQRHYCYGDDCGDVEGYWDNSTWSEEYVLQQTDINIGDYLVFTHPDGMKTMSRVEGYMTPLDFDDSTLTPFDVTSTLGSQPVIGQNYDIDHLTERLFRESSTPTGFYRVNSDVWKFPVQLSWFNCYTFGNGVESDRIRDDFNAPQIDNGAKVSSTLLNYGREIKGSSMIYSGIYNSTSGKNDLNEFNMAQKITKDINPSYGSIQALKTRDTDMVVFTEDKTLRVMANKDALYNADGNPQLIATDRVLGQAVPFSGDYGISKNPESLAWDQFRIYFTDKQRGAVLRLSMDGLTPISQVGMKTWFRENLREMDKALGTFDVVNGEYNLTLKYSSEKPSTTVTFNEESKGWVSFKSFIPQTGLSIGGKYITAISENIDDSDSIKKGIWEHYVDVISANNNSVNFGEIINKNVFYAPMTTITTEASTLSNYYENSSVTVMFNDMPEIVKGFRTVNYDGSQAKVDRLGYVNSTNPDGTVVTNISDGLYTNLSEKDGWWVDNIETDLSEQGNVENFIRKEGKWFQNIGGATRKNLEPEDLREFNVQGLGLMVPDPYAEEEEPPVDQTTFDADSDYIDDPTNLTD